MGILGAGTCRECSRVWLPELVLTAIVQERAATARVEPPALLHEIAPTASSLACPDDGLALVTVRQRGVEFLRCEECGGLFIGALELRVLLDRVIRAGRQLQGTRRKPGKPRGRAESRQAITSAAIHALLHLVAPWA